MFGLFETLLVLVLKLHIILNTVLDLFMLVRVNLLQMVDFAFLLLQVISNARVLVLI